MAATRTGRAFWTMPAASSPTAKQAQPMVRARS